MRKTLSALGLLVLVVLMYGTSPCLAGSATSIPRPFGKVAVISVLGTTLHAVRMGITVFNDSDYSVDVPDWGIDQDAADFLRTTLEAEGYSASELSITRRVPAPDYDQLRQLAAEQGFDTLIVVSGAQAAHSTLIEPGFGLYAQFKAVFPYASIGMRVDDVKTGKRIAVASEGATEAFPDKALVWKGKFGDYSEQEQERIRSGIEDHIHKNLLRMLTAKHIIRSDHKP